MSLPADAVPTDSVLRALLVTDLVDSTRLVERLGDRRSAQVLAREQEVARALAQRHGGTEIDRSDGFLFLFDHAWQAVAFAIGYHEAIDSLSAELPFALQSRIGIHVGDVYLVRNSAADVARGAKPVEVAGLAKPVAARLMSAAAGGQTLLSGVAHDLAVRACQEHLEGVKLRWHCHGDFAIKGVDDPMQVYEVGTEQRTIGHAPAETDKVRSLRRRSRRRILQAAGLTALAAALPGGYWLWQRRPGRNWESQWLVLAEWTSNLDDPELPRVLATAFRIALQQSRFAYVIDPAAVEQTLGRLERSGPIDVEAALEVARQEGAIAVIAPALAGFSGGLLLSASIIESARGSILHAVQEQIPDLSMLTRGLDALTTSIRRAVGEPEQVIQRDSRPLAEVTTGNLDALGFYAEAESLVRRQEHEQAIRKLEQAIVLDPEFGSAYAKLGTLHAIRRASPGTAENYWRQAAQLTGRLSHREKMYIDGCLSWIEDPVQMRGRWAAMAATFPDDAAAANNAAIVDWTHFGDFAAAEQRFRSATRIPHPWNYAIWHHLGYTLLGMDRVADSLQAFDESLQRAQHPTHFGLVRAQIVAGKLVDAEQLLERFRGAGSINWQLDHAEGELLLAASRSDFAAVLKVCDRLRDLALAHNYRNADRVALRTRMHVLSAQGDDAGARAAAEELRVTVLPELHAPAGGAMALPLLDILELTWTSVARGWDGALSAFDPESQLTGRWARFPVLLAGLSLWRGWTALRRGQVEEALRHALESRAQLPLFAAFDLELAALAAAGMDQARAQRRRQVAASLHLALAEGYNHYATHLPNLLLWQRLAGSDTEPPGTPA